MRELRAKWPAWLEGARSKADVLLSRRAWPIRAHLAIFAISLLAPILLFSSILARHFIASERRTNEQQLLSLASAITADLDREISGMVSTLKALANSPSLQSEDFAAFYRQAKHTLQPMDRNAVLMDLSGKQLVNTRLLWGTPLPTTARNGSRFAANVVERGQTHVSDLFQGTVSQQSLLSVTLPVMRDDKPAYVLVMSMTPEQFLPVLNQSRLPPGWHAGISDRQGHIIAQTGSRDSYVGTQIPETTSKPDLEEGVIVTRGPRDRPFLYAFHRSDLSGWRVAVWAPISVIEAPLRRLWQGLAALGASALGLALLLALYFGRRLSLPIAAAAEAGRLLGQGKPLRPLASPLSEANEVVDALRTTSVLIRQRTRELRNSEARLRLAQTVAGLATFDWNLQTGQMLCSDNFNSLFGLPEGAPVEPDALREMIHPDDRERVRAAVEEVRRRGGSYDVEFRILTPAHEERWIAGSGEAILDHDDTPQRIIGASYDVTEFKRAAETNSQLAAIVQTSLDAVMSLSTAGVVQTWNPGAEHLLGYGADEIVGRSARILYPESEAAEFDANYDKLLRGEAVRQDGVRRHKDGRLLHVNVNIAPMFTPDGRLSGFSAIVRDISDRKQHEEHLSFVMRELSHRSKNLLAVIQAMARQTAKSSADLEDFEKNYSQRLQALSASHDLLVHQNWHGAPLSELLRLILTPFVNDIDERVALAGPAVFVSPTAAQNLALSVHELATNASKYGALSVPSGRVEIAWQFVSRDGANDRFSLNWRESGGPPVSEPRRKGFGHIVIQKMIAQALDAEVKLDFAPKGVTWALDMPASYIVR